MNSRIPLKPNWEPDTYAGIPLMDLHQAWLDVGLMKEAGLFDDTMRAAKEFGLQERIRKLRAELAELEGEAP